MKNLIFTGVLVALLVPSVFAAHEHNERHYQNQWCQDHVGEQEVVLPDKTRADCLTLTHAVEVEFGNKWAESIGQSLFYALQTDKRPGVVLVIESVEDRRYWYRLNTFIREFNLPIDTWATGKGAP